MTRSSRLTRGTPHAVALHALLLGLAGGLAGALATKLISRSLDWGDALGVAQGLGLLVGIPALLAPLCARGSRPLLLLVLCVWGAAWVLVPAGLVADVVLRARWEGVAPLEAHDRLAERLLRFWRLGTAEFGLLLAGPLPLLALGLLRLAPRRAPAWAHLLVGTGAAHAAAVVLFCCGDGVVPLGALAPGLLGGPIAAAAAALVEDALALRRRLARTPAEPGARCPTFGRLRRAGWGPRAAAAWLLAGLALAASWWEHPRALARMLAGRLGTAGDDTVDGQRLAWLLHEVPAASAVAVPELAAALGEARLLRRLRVLDLLDWIEAAAELRPVLERLLLDPDATLRLRAARALDRLGDPRSLTALRAAWAREPDWGARLAMAEARTRLEGGAWTLSVEWEARASHPFELEATLRGAWADAQRRGDIELLRALVPILWDLPPGTRGLATWRADVAGYRALEAEVAAAKGRGGGVSPAGRSPAPRAPPR